MALLPGTGEDMTRGSGARSLIGLGVKELCNEFPLDSVVGSSNPTLAISVLLPHSLFHPLSPCV